MEQLNRHVSFYDKDTIDTIKYFSEVFDDSEFISDLTSLINFDDNKLTNEEKIKWLEYEWKRVPEIYKNISLLVNPSSIDINQGSLGNCYLLSVGACVAEFPCRLEKIFYPKEINKTGIYAVKFFINGKIKLITIDDKIPSYKNLPAFAKVNRKSKNIWPLIVEKAWAKYLGNYQNTISGSPFEFFKILTGAPSYYIITEEYISDEDTLWEKLQNCYLRNYFMCAGTMDELANNEINNESKRLIEQIKLIGLSLKHAYSCLFFYEFQSSGKILKLVKIRNPWGHLEQSKIEGEVITKSYHNDPNIIKNLGDPSNFNKEGCIVLTFEEFIKYFNAIYVCEYIDNYMTVSHELYNNCLKPNRHFHIITVDLSHTLNNDKIYFSVNQPTEFVFNKNRKNDDKNKYLRYSIFIAKFIDNTNPYLIEYIGFKEGSRNVFIELENYQKSHYLLLIHCDEIVDRDFSAFLSVYSNHTKIFIQEIFNIDESKIFQYLIYDFYKTFDSQFKGTLEILKQSEEGSVHYNSFRIEKSGYSFVLFANRNKFSEMRIWISDIQCDRKKLILGDRVIGNELECILGPGEFLILPHYNTSIKYEFSILLIKSREILKHDLTNNCYRNEIHYSGKIFYYFLKHDAGICFCFVNNLCNLIGIEFKLKKIENLTCNENIKDNLIEIFLSRNERIFFFFDKIKISTGFNLLYSLNLKK